MRVRWGLMGNERWTMYIEKPLVSLNWGGWSEISAPQSSCTVNFPVHCIRHSCRTSVCLIEAPCNAYQELSEMLQLVSPCQHRLNECIWESWYFLLMLKLYGEPVWEVTRKDYRVRSRWFFIYRSFNQFPEFNWFRIARDINGTICLSYSFCC